MWDVPGCTAVHNALACAAEGYFQIRLALQVRCERTEQLNQVLFIVAFVDARGPGLPYLQDSQSIAHAHTSLSLLAYGRISLLLHLAHMILYSSNFPSAFVVVRIPVRSALSITIVLSRFVGVLCPLCTLTFE